MTNLNASNAAPTPGLFLCSCSVLLTASLHSLGVTRQCWQLLLYFCWAGAALLLPLLLPCSEHWQALISSHPGQAVGLFHPMRTLLTHKLDQCAGSFPWYTCLQYLHSTLCWHDLSFSSIILTWSHSYPFSLAILITCTSCVHDVRHIGVTGSWEGSCRFTGPLLTPPTSTLRNDPLTRTNWHKIQTLFVSCTCWSG